MRVAIITAGPRISTLFARAADKPVAVTSRGRVSFVGECHESEGPDVLVLYPDPALILQAAGFHAWRCGPLSDAATRHHTAAAVTAAYRAYTRRPLLVGAQLLVSGRTPRESALILGASGIVSLVAQTPSPREAWRVGAALALACEWVVEHPDLVEALAALFSIEGTSREVSTLRNVMEVVDERRSRGDQVDDVRAWAQGALAAWRL